MLAIRLETFLSTQIDILAKARHTSRSNIVRQAIIRFLEDCEDIELAHASQKKIKSTKSLSQIRKTLGLEGKDRESR